MTLLSSLGAFTHYKLIKAMRYDENLNISGVTFLFWSFSYYFIFVYSSYLTVILSALRIWINHPHAIKTNFANVSVVVELFI